MQDLEPTTYITNPVEIAAHLDSLVLRRIRGDLKIAGREEAVRVVFLGHSGDGSHLLLERLIALTDSSDRIDIGKDATVEYMIEGIGYSFESRSIDIEELDGSIRLQFPHRLIKSQKRQFFRIQPLHPVFEVTINTETISERCPVSDISGGGISFLTDLGDYFLNPGTELKGLEFVLPNGYIVKANGILRSHIATNDRDPRKRYRCGVEFVGLHESIRDKIVVYVFNRQKEELKWRRERV